MNIGTEDDQAIGAPLAGKVVRVKAEMVVVIRESGCDDILSQIIDARRDMQQALQAVSPSKNDTRAFVSWVITSEAMN